MILSQRQTLAGCLACLLLMGFVATAQAQPPRAGPGRPGPYAPSVGAQSYRNLHTINPNYYIGGQNIRQTSYNMAVLGNGLRHIPPYALGYNPYVRTVNNFAPSYGGYGYDGYGYGGYNPYYGYNGDGLASYGGYLRGAADLTAATGQYWQSIESARVTREQARQANLDTRKKQFELELEYEKYKVTAPKIHEYELQTEQNRARRDPPSTEVWSGKSLNVLYRSVLEKGSSAGTGPTIPLDDNILKGINLSTKTSRGGLGLLKDNGRLIWPDPLQEKDYDEVRNRFSKNFARVAEEMNRVGEPPDRATKKDLKADLESMSAILDSQVKDLSPSEYIGSRRYLNQLKDTLTALSDPTLTRSTSVRLPATVNSVGGLVTYMQNNGLEFAPAVAPGDEPAYTALYYALRAYEASVKR